MPWSLCGIERSMKCSTLYLKRVEKTFCLRHTLKPIFESSLMSLFRCYCCTYKPITEVTTTSKGRELHRRRSRVSAVGIVSRQRTGPDGPVCVAAEATYLSFLQNRPDQLWDPSSFLLKGCPRILPRGCKAAAV
jgi:hypothetical protein